MNEEIHRLISVLVNENLQVGPNQDLMKISSRFRTELFNQKL